MTRLRQLLLTCAAIGTVIAALPALAQEQPPAPGASPRVDAIRKAGALRVAVLANAPWLIENTTGTGEKWSGPAWVLAGEYARLLGVKLDPILVSHETKVPVLAANQVDLSITPLAETPERDAVVDFVLYSNTSVCMFGRADNPRFTAAKTVDDLNKPEITIAYFIGGGEEAWVKQRFPKAKLRRRHQFGRDGAARGRDGKARRRRADQPHSLRRDEPQGQGPRRAAAREQLPGQQGEGAAGRPCDRQEPAGLPRLAARR